VRDFNIILHPTDFSTNAQHALELACGLVRDMGVRLIVLHVAPPLPTQWVGSGLSMLHSHKDLWDTEARLQQVGCGIVQPERLLRTGEPTSVINRVAKQLNADLIVMGRPQSNRWRWLVEERVAQTVARTAPCAVLIAASPKAQATEGPGLCGQATRGRGMRAMR
jgi:nucleotide-binding universal stress UspA family protein